MKNKYPYLILFLVVSILSIGAIEIIEECDATALKKELKRELRPDFKYDSSKTSRFTYKTKPQIKEIEVPLFIGEKYRFLFNTTGLPLKIKIDIYNKQLGHKNRKLLYTLDKKEGQDLYTFEPEKSRKMYINYIIPESIEENLNGCMIFVLGYRLSVLN